MSVTATLISVDEASRLLGHTPHSVMRLVRQGKFVIKQVPSEKQVGKKVTLLAVDSLPPAAQRRWREAHAAAMTAETEALDSRVRGNDKAGKDQQQEWASTLQPDHLARVTERLAIVNELIRAEQEAPYGVRSSVIEAICEKHDVSKGTLYRWFRSYGAKGIQGLADGRFGQTRTTLTTEVADYIVGLLAKEPHRRPARVHEYVENRFKVEISYTTIHRFISNWKNKNHAAFAALDNPDKYKSNYQIALGDMSEKAKHFLHYVEMDSSPADVLCNDGKRYTLIAAVDVFTRKAICLVRPTSNSAGIADVLRQVLTDWGVPEHLVKDNGQDYVSKHIKQIQAAFAIHSPFVPHFTPEAKPHVERFFGTIARGLLEELPGYIGHSVADRKAIESRRTFADRILKKGETLAVNKSPEELQTAVTAWLERIYDQRIHRGENMNVSPTVKLAQSPKQPARVTDLAALEIVLMPEAERTVFKKGIKIENGWYQSAELSRFINEKVRVKINTNDITELYVYTMEGRFISKAYDSKARPMSIGQMTAAKKLQKKEIRAKVSALKALGDALPDPMAALLELKGAEKKVAALVRSGEHTNPALTQAANAIAGKGFGKTIAESMDQYGQADDPLDFEPIANAV